jgi:hypothetical protein
LETAALLSLSSTTPLRETKEAELVAQYRTTADVGVRDFNIFLLQRQNELTEGINGDRRLLHFGSAKQQKKITT